jgi:glycosyltransferase involved in cell wall biosynthesis/Flp pilus assembly protein TadD
LNPSPLVSIIVRSHGLGGLLAALTSVAAQSYRHIEVIVVDTTGHPDSAWPTIGWPAEFQVHWISGHQRLSDASAANMALEAVHGEFFCFLDDNGVFDMRHVENLIRAAAHRPDALVFYGRSRVAGAANGAESLIGRPLNRALFFHDQLFCLTAALIRRSVLERGCRFDETLDFGAEHDFLEQVAMNGDFVFLANAPPTCACAAPDSGSGARAPSDLAQRLYFDNQRFAKWTGERVYHGLRAAFLCGRATRALDAGNVDAARAAYDEVLVAYPGDPDALHGMARCDIATGRLQSAWQHVAEAIDFDPVNADYRRTAGLIRQRSAAAGIDVPLPEAGPPFGFTAGESVLTAPASIAPQIEVTARAVVTARGALCPCGSGKRYKHCCGRLSDGVAAPTAHAAVSVVRRARELLQTGAANEAASLLSRVAPHEIADAQTALEAGRIYVQLHLLQPAFALFERALQLDGNLRDAASACDECCRLMFRASAWQSASRSIRTLLDRQAARAGAAPRVSDEIHIVCKLDTVGGTERRALNLYRQLSAHARVTLWTTAPPLAVHGGEAPLLLITPDNTPAGGTLVLVGTYFDCGGWLQSAPFERIVICHNLVEQYASLVERLIQIGENASHPQVALTFPSQLFREAMALPGVVEYTSVDVEAFQRTEPASARRTRLVVGRHGRAYPLKFHPNDPEFFRNLMARGYDVRILGGAPIAAAFAGQAGVAPELLDVNAESVRAFLERLDVFVYRKHPAFFETGGTAVLEAMAMELPVVMFPEQCGIAEIIRDTENGFFVDSEARAIEVIDQLALDRELRVRVGRAARASVVALMRDQQPRLLDFYLGAGGMATPHASNWWRRLLAWPRAGAARPVG